MCLIINKKPSDVIGEYFFKNTWERNNDGYGILYRDGDSVIAKKGLKYEDFLKDYAGLEARECLIHFRMATHGIVDSENLHPFQIVPNLWVMHNGIIDAPEYLDKNKSDTWRLVNLVLKPIFEKVENPSEFLRSDSFVYLISALSGTSNRLAFMDKQGIYLMPSIGAWDVTTKGLSVSNTYAYTVDKVGYSLSHYTNKYGDWEDYIMPEVDNVYGSKGYSNGTEYLLNQAGNYAEDYPLLYAEDYEDNLQDAIEACENFPESAGELLHDLCKERAIRYEKRKIKAVAK